MKSEDEKAAKEHSKNATDFPSLQIWIEEGFLAGIAHQKARERWRKYPEEKPEGLDLYLIIIRDDLAEYCYSMTAIWDGGEWDFTGDTVPPQHTVTYWKPIELPTKEGE